jgi:hypothetical protein
MAEEASSPKRINRQSIAPPEEPDEVTLARLRDQFEMLPRITEAWLTGSRLTPEDGSPPYETTDILLVLDPPLDRDSISDLHSQIEELEESIRGHRLQRRTASRLDLRSGSPARSTSTKDLLTLELARALRGHSLTLAQGNA